MSTLGSFIKRDTSSYLVEHFQEFHFFFSFCFSFQDFQRKFIFFQDFFAFLLVTSRVIVSLCRHFLLKVSMAHTKSKSLELKREPRRLPPSFSVSVKVKSKTRKGKEENEFRIKLRHYMGIATTKLIEY